ncbi:MAG TPA: potassium transporter Kup [Thermoanaerobaculia bacterium]|nr:potassium transporter Kup [Thermoanaerobaculia bacterium]
MTDREKSETEPAAPVPGGTLPGRSVAEGRYLFILSLTALGVVYGDIGTSPLYAIKECFHGPHSVAASAPNVLGVLSLIFWSLVIVICIKYLGFILRANNRGEGGVIALMALVAPTGRRSTRKRSRVLLFMGLFGAALLYGDGMITPAISVLSAVEGLEVAFPRQGEALTTAAEDVVTAGDVAASRGGIGDYVVPITIVILVALFMFQRRGTAGVGAVFGPVTALWFLTIAALGTWQIGHAPRVLAAVLPNYAVEFFVANQMRGFFVLGSVFLVVTGAEALYADIGHFGLRPIRLTWFGLVFPALLLNYFGQGALLLRNPEAAVNPFFNMGPEWARLPMIVIATAATVIASQAVISGSFSLTRQAIQLGYIPRLQIEHTSAREIGQIYVPAVNWALAIACIGLVIGFGSSSRLAAAYGVAVTTDMVFTAILFAIFLRRRWKWALPAVLLLTAGFLVVDLAFWTANIVKVPDGGWFPLVVAAIAFTLMTTWFRGRAILNQRLSEGRLSDEMFVTSIEKNLPLRVPGCAVFMDRTPEATPHALLHNLKHNKVLHEQVILLTVLTEETPHVDEKERLEIIPRGLGIFRVVVRFGFMEDPDIPEILTRIPRSELEIDLDRVSFFLGRETLIPVRKPSLRGMAIWRERLFAWMARNSAPATRFFRIPPNRVVEMGAQIEL